MSTNTPDQQITYPALGDLANNPTAFLDQLADIEQRLVRQYTDVTDRLARMLALTENQISSLSTENRLDVYDGTNHVSLATRAHNNFLRRSVDAPIINNSAVLVADTVLVAPIVPTGSSTYMFDACLFYDGSTAGDLKVTFDVPAFTLFRWVGLGLAPAVTATIGDVKLSNIIVSGATDSWAGLGVGTNTSWTAHGFITTATAGDIQLSYAQQAADPTNLTIKAGSWLRVTRVA